MDESLTKELAAERAAVVAQPMTLARALELVDWLQATPDGLLATNVARESLCLFAALVRPLADEEVTPAETIDLGLGNTAMNAEYWSRCTRKTEDPAEAVMCMEQARNAWKNAAYAFARKLAAPPPPFKATHQHAEGGLYEVLDDKNVKAQINGHWLSAVRYRNAEGMEFVRDAGTFGDRFTPL